MQTTPEILNELVTTLRASYDAQLQKLPMKKATRETLVDGFTDGARTAAFHVARMLGALPPE